MSQSVLVVGASRGIGAAIAQRFLDAGDKVTGTHRGGGVPVEGVTPVECDVTDTGSVNAAVAAASEINGPVETLIFNPGIARDGLAVRMSDDDFDAVHDVVAKGAFRAARAVLKPMMRARSGSIVFISSVGSAAGVPGQANYTSAKASLTGLARTLAREYAPYSVRTNVLAPGPVETEMTTSLTDKQREDMLAMTLLRRFARPDEIADAAYWLSRSTYITGVTLPVAGGAAIGI